VEASAAKPQRAGASQDNWDSPCIPVSANAPPDKMIWKAVTPTATSMPRSDVATKAEISRARHIEAMPSRAMARKISTNGMPVRNDPCGGIGRLINPSPTSTADWMTTITPSTSSLENRCAPADSPAARSLM
jgi:hypothetical protein